MTFYLKFLIVSKLLDDNIFLLKKSQKQNIQIHLPVSPAVTL